MKNSLACALVLSLSGASSAADHSSILSKVNLPPGFKISVFAEMPKPRSIEVENGVIYVGSRHGHIYAIADSNQDGVADKISRIADGLNVPNGIAVQDSFLYAGLQDRIARWSLPNDVNDTMTLKQPETIKDGFKNNPHHGWRYIDFGPDGKLYVTLGAPCNICELEENTGKIVRTNPDGSDYEIVADGVRNSVGLDWHPVTGELWFTDNGADRMGDDIPADELNRVTNAGQFFGFPYLGGKSTRLTGYENAQPPVEAVPAEIEFQAHTASLGIDFYTGDMFPPEYKNDAFVAQHGSWNRSEPVGYRIMRVLFDDSGNATGTEVFADGWLSEGSAIGRPVDIEELSDGSLLVSDDFSNVIYRITYGE